MHLVNGFERPAFQWLFVGLGAALIVVAVAEAVALRRARAEFATLQAADLTTQEELNRVRGQLAREQASREALTLQLGRQASAVTVANQPTLTLSPLHKRGAQPPEPTVTKPPDHQSIQLRLVVPGRSEPADARYSIVIRKWSGGETVWSRSGLRLTTMEDKRPVVTAFITGDVFAPGAYELALLRIATDTPVEVAGYEVSVR